jgi:hypothetical protein
MEMEKHESSGGGWHSWKEGVNRIRILPYPHKFTKFDVAAKRARDDHVGQTLEHFFVSTYSVFASNRFNLCWAERAVCPWWKKYDAASDEAKKKGTVKAPALYFYFNAIDLDELHKGVQVMRATRQVFMGARFNDGSKKAYGIMDYYNGYQPDGPDEEATGPTDIEETDKVGVLGPKDALGDTMLGLRGRDIYIQMKVQKSTFNPNKTFIAANHDAKGGAVALRKAENCAVLEDHWMEGVVDLHSEQKYYPGWDPDGKYAHPIVAEFVRFQSGEEPKVEDGVELDTARDDSSPDLDIEEDGDDKPKGKYASHEEANADAKPGQKIVKHRDGSFSIKGKPIEPQAEGPSDFTAGCRVIATDTDSDPVRKYKATFIGFTHDDEGNVVGEVSILPGDQDDDGARETITQARDGASADQLKDGGVVFQIATDDLEIDNEFQPVQALDIE